MDADGYILVRMGADGCMDTEGSKNKTKRATNGRGRHVFATHTHNEIKQEVCRDGHGEQRGLF